MKLCVLTIATLLVTATSLETQKEIAEGNELTREETPSLVEHKEDEAAAASEKRSCIEEWKTCENSCECCGSSTICSSTWAEGKEIKLCKNEGGTFKKVLHFIQKGISKLKSCKEGN
uniref:U30-theraphotoxin-Cg1b n=1 Tax=Chilobrachys guangxiensis TaxID=278060 RepID=TX32B_CHIGU|nr:RecName: Full=U30-theraphotoxin-Cg1b; Short=U30-TRTX-Cg1b; AltName: Full=Jingzhaotoxin-63; Short=JZTX-63; AltName: Full=Peptide F5-9.19; Flags: Precursor [Chilobrachys guangxiensis]ABY71732.1 cystine knot toxin [Chilobrachys guangxiensis]